MEEFELLRKRLDGTKVTVLVGLGVFGTFVRPDTVECYIAGSTVRWVVDAVRRQGNQSTMPSRDERSN